MPANLHHYDLHVWLFKLNPAGLFNVVNRRSMSEDRLYLFGAPVQDRPEPVRRGAYSVATGRANCASAFDPGATINPSLQCSGPDSAEEPSVHSRDEQ